MINVLKTYIFKSINVPRFPVVYFVKTKRRLHNLETEHSKALSRRDHSSVIADHVKQLVTTVPETVTLLKMYDDQRTNRQVHKIHVFKMFITAVSVIF